MTDGLTEIGERVATPRGAGRRSYINEDIAHRSLEPLPPAIDRAILAANFVILLLLLLLFSPRSFDIYR